MRLIDADALYFAQRFAVADPDSKKMIPVLAVDKSCVESAPTIDGVPVVRGRWYLNEDKKWACTECNGLAICHPDEPDRWQAITTYCPHCGAKME